MDYIQHFVSPIGRLTMASDGEHLTGLWFDGQKYFGSTLEAVFEEKDLPVFQQTKDWLKSYFAGRKPTEQVPLLLKGSPFQQEVWNLLSSIPYGETTTYGRIARLLEVKNPGRKVSAQAVGGAVGRNPISLIIPCHRVVGVKGQLTGYAGGIEKKKWLLALEQAN